MVIASSETSERLHDGGHVLPFLRSQLSVLAVLARIGFRLSYNVTSSFFKFGWTDPIRDRSANSQGQCLLAVAKDRQDGMP